MEKYAIRLKAKQAETLKTAMEEAIRNDYTKKMHNLILVYSSLMQQTTDKDIDIVLTADEIKLNYDIALTADEIKLCIEALEWYYNRSHKKTANNLKNYLIDFWRSE